MLITEHFWDNLRFDFANIRKHGFDVLLRYNCALKQAYIPRDSKYFHVFPVDQ